MAYVAAMTVALVAVCFQHGVHSLAVTDSGVDSVKLHPGLTWKLNHVASRTHFEEALDYSETVFDKLKRLEGTIAGSRVQVVRGGTTYAQIIDGQPTPDTQRQDVLARNVLRASSFFVNRFCVTADIPSYECGLYLSSISVPRGATFGRECRSLIEEKEYRDDYRRLLPAAYDDGIYAFRRSTAFGELPMARDISSKFHARSVDTRDATHSVALVQWSQFIEHDLTKTIVQTMHDGVDIECCSADHGQLLPRYRHPSCKPLQVREDDPYYRTYRTTCLNYVRSALSVGEGCPLGPANQLNQATDRLDLSQLYGNRENDTWDLRTGKGGRLRSHLFDSIEYLSEASSGKLCAADANLETVCYESGDTRVNVNPYITLLHTLFLRSHNRLAKRLALLETDWTDEQLFWAARMINTRIYHRIVREWMVAVVGGQPSDIPPAGVDFPGSRDRVSNEFATAAIRFYNTMMPGEIVSGGSGSYDLEKLFYRPKDLRKRDYFAHLVGSVLTQNAMSLDTAYVDDLAHLLFGSRNVGLDVLALDIQRGRDHGLARYTDYYKLCNVGSSVSSWADLESALRPDDLATIRATYATVHDVDLIVGALAEWPRAGATVGPTLSCLIREQIVNSLQLRASPSDDLLLNETLLETLLDGYSAARFMCDTAQLERVQRDVFRVPNAVDNPQVPCAQLPSLDVAQLFPYRQ